MPGRRSKLQEGTHFRVLILLEDTQEMSQRELANAVGVSVGGIHYALIALVEKCLIKLADFTAAKDRRWYAYILTPKGIARKAVLTWVFLARKIEEFEALRIEIQTVQSNIDNVSIQKRS